MSDIPPDNSPPETPRRVELPPVREFNDRATLWLLEDPHNLRDLLKIHSPQLVEHLDFDRAERLNRSFIPPDLQKYEEIERTLREAMTGLEKLDEELAGQWLRVAWYLLLLVTHRRNPTESPNLVELLQEQSRQSKFRAREEWQTMEISYADYLKEQGEARGMRTALATMLIARFGKLPKKVREVITTADMDKINTWIQAGATANTLEEIGILSPQ